MRADLDVFDAHTETFRTKVGASFIVTNRSRCKTLGGYATIHAKSQESFSLAYLLAPLPRHDFWSEECRVSIPSLPRSAFHLMDLRAGGNARFGSSFDTLNVLIPREALRHLSELHGCLPPRDLREKSPWNIRDPVIEGLERLLLQATVAQGAVDSLVADQLNLTLVTHVAVRYGGMKKAEASRAGALAHWQLRRATELMECHLADPIPLMEIARHCDITPSQFSRAFKAATGITPSTWLSQLRVDRAKDLLRESTLPLSGIAYRCGFADQPHFTRVFSRAVGMTPGAWRQRYKRNWYPTELDQAHSTTRK